MHRIAAWVLVSSLAAGAAHAARAPASPRRILIIADELSLQFRSTPRLRSLISRTMDVIGHDGHFVRVALTGGPRTPPAPTPAWKTTVGMALAPGAVASADSTSSDATELHMRADRSSSAAAAALRSMASARSGPVTVVYFTEGYPASVPEPTEFVEEALRVHAEVYVIEPRGIDAEAIDGRRFEPWDATAWNAYVAATRGWVQGLARRTNGVAVFTRAEFDAFLSKLGGLHHPLSERDARE